VQYDATIPDEDDDLGFGDGVPILLADPFAGFRTIDAVDAGIGPSANRRINPSADVVPPPKGLPQLYSVPGRG
jgi:hypothetical protein